MKWYMWSSTLLVGIITFVIILVASINGADTYKGRVNFATESDYSAFKQELISTNAKYFDNSNPPSVYVDVLNQQPPILINFVTIPLQHVQARSGFYQRISSFCLFCGLNLHPNIS